jgi:hypothetical protein
MFKRTQGIIFFDTSATHKANVQQKKDHVRVKIVIAKVDKRVIQLFLKAW